MTDLDTFLWGAIGGLAFESLRAVGYLRTIRHFVRLDGFWLTTGLLVILQAAVGGGFALLVLGSFHGSRWSAAIFVGFAGASFWQTLVRTALVRKREELRREVESHGATPSREPSEPRVKLSPERVSAAAAVGGFLIALLTYLTK